MAMADDIEKEVSQIERLALDWYELFMRQFGFKWDGNGSVMLDPERPQPPTVGVNQPVDTAEQTRVMQENFRLFRNDLDQLLNKFRGYYTLAPHEVIEVRDRIGGHPEDVGNGANTSVHDRLSLAFDPWLLEVMDLVDTDDWSGPAATAFQSSFIKPFNRTAEIQKACVRELGITAWLWNKAIDAAAKNVLEIARACVYRMSHPAGMSTAEVDFLSVTSLITGVLSFGSVPAGVVSLTTAVLTFADGINKRLEKKFDYYIFANTPHETVLATYEILAEVDKQLVELDDGIAAALDEDLNSGNGFGHESIRLPQIGMSGGMGTVDVSSAKVVTSIVELHRAGSTNLPIIADQYSAAASILGGSVPPVGVYRFMGRSAAKFDQGVDMVMGALRDTGAATLAAGEALVKTADEYQLTDDQRAEVMRQISAQQEQKVWVGDEPERATGI